MKCAGFRAGKAACAVTRSDRVPEGVPTSRLPPGNLSEGMARSAGRERPPGVPSVDVAVRSPGTASMYRPETWVQVFGDKDALDDQNTVALRQEFVTLARAEGANIAELCRRYGISLKSGYKWLARAREAPESALADRAAAATHPGAHESGARGAGGAVAGCASGMGTAQTAAAAGRS
jgi:hypothetical protein